MRVVYNVYTHYKLRYKMSNPTYDLSDIKKTWDEMVVDLLPEHKLEELTTRVLKPSNGFSFICSTPYDIPKPESKGVVKND